MSLPLLRTKLYIPRPLPGRVPRPRLVEHLNESLDRKLTLISAPAGFGKTTLLSQWIPTSQRCVCWLSLDGDDNDPVRFWHYVVASLQMLQEDLGTAALSLLRSPQPFSIEVFLTTLINELSAFHDPFALVFDDYHHIEAGAIHDAVGFLLDHLPRQMHLILATRADPPLPLPRLRIRAELTELRVDDLRFTPGEVTAFFDQALGPALAPEHLQALEARTEGWAAGLQAAALSMQGRPDATEIHDFVRAFTGSHRYILDYLADEVLRRQPLGVQTFLLQTSILDQFSADLADAVTGGTVGREILHHLEGANLFLVPLDDERQWYRYHHLFADFLRSSLAAAGVDPLPLHQRAAAWYAEHGLAHQAIAHWLAAGDDAHAAELIARNSVPMLIEGQVATLRGWLEGLPPTLVRQDPRLHLAQAWLLLITGQPQAARQQAVEIEAALETTAAHLAPEDRQSLRGQLATLQATIAASLRDAGRTIDYGQQALNLLDAGDGHWRSTVLWNLAFAHRLRGDFEAAGGAYERAIATGQAANNQAITILATTGLGNLQVAQGHLHRARQTYERALALTAGGQAPSVHALDAYLGLAGLHYEWNRLAEAEGLARQAIALSRQLGNQDTLAAGYGKLALVQQARGELAAASASLEDALRLARAGYVRDEARITETQARLLLAQGQTAAAAQVAAAFDLPLIAARCAVAQEEAAQALSLLDDLPPAPAVHEQRFLLQSLLLRALAYRAAGHREQALETLGKVLALARPGGYIRLFVDEGPSLAELLHAAASRGPAPEYVGQLLAAFESAQPEQGTGEPPSPHPSPLVEPLTDRQREVLRLLVAGMSNQEIAEELVITVGTVKRHVHTILGKLDTRNRTEAAARARELHLLADQAQTQTP